MSESTPFGAIVIRRAGQGGPPTAGDIVDVYPLAEAFDRSVYQHRAVENLPQSDAVHSYAHTMGPQVMQAVRTKQVRRVGQLTCTCAKAGRIATIVVGPDGHRWAVIVPERMPTAFWRLDVHRTPSAWPLHMEPHGFPHVEITTCPACGARWLLLLDPEGPRRIRCGRPSYGATVQP